MFRYGVLFALTVLAGLVLANALGEKPTRDRAESRIAGLEVTAPTRVRGGLFFQGRFRMEARTLIDHATQTPTRPRHDRQARPRNERAAHR